MLNALKVGNLTSFLSEWRTITSDSEILDTITGTTIDFRYLPVQHGPPAIRYIRYRLQGHILEAYIYDNYTQGDSYTECLTTVLETLKLFVDLGFCGHPEK